MCARTPPPPAAQPPTPAHPPGPPPRAPVGAGHVAGRSLIVHLTVDRTGGIGPPVSRREGVQMVSTAGQLARFLNKNQAEGGRFEPAQRRERLTRSDARKPLQRKGSHLLRRPQQQPETTLKNPDSPPKTRTSPGFHRGAQEHRHEAVARRRARRYGVAAPRAEANHAGMRDSTRAAPPRRVSLGYYG